MDGMKILIAYDGTANSDAALASLRRAGLPEIAEAIVLTVSDVWLPTAAEEHDFDDDDDDHVVVSEGRALHALREARQTASIACERLREWFPKWSVRIEARSDAPAWGILERASSFRADLVVVGTHGRSLVGRMFLGSVSQKVLSESKCSVHIGRQPRSLETPLRIIVGVDGSADAHAAVEEIAARHWPSGSEIHLVTAYAPLDLHYAPAVVSPPSEPALVGDDELSHVRETIEREARLLEAAGLNVVRSVRIGVPVPVLLDEAETWAADAIVLGAQGHRVIEWLLLGSVSSTVALRAPCSVEVIRRRAS